MILFDVKHQSIFPHLITLLSKVANTNLKNVTMNCTNLFIYLYDYEIITVLHNICDNSQFTLVPFLYGCIDLIYVR